MRADASWAIMSVIIILAMVISFLAAYVAEGLSRPIFAVCGMCFALVFILISMTRKMYLKAFDRTETVRCLHLKRPGLEIRGDPIQPKGKIPKG